MTLIIIIIRIVLNYANSNIWKQRIAIFFNNFLRLQLKLASWIIQHVNITKWMHFFWNFVFVYMLLSRLAFFYFGFLDYQKEAKQKISILQRTIFFFQIFFIIYTGLRTMTRHVKVIFLCHFITFYLFMLFPVHNQRNL